MDLDVDSYFGIALDVRFEVSAEMVYKGSVMNYTVKDTRIFQVRNSSKSALKAEESKGISVEAVERVACPRVKIDFSGFRATERPCEIELYLHDTHLHIDRDQITGHLRMKKLAREI